MEPRTTAASFAGLRVLSLESRRAAEMEKLIANYGGKPLVAPSMREVPLDSNVEAIDFARALAQGGFEMVIFLTGVGTRALARVVETIYPREQFLALLRQTSIVARGPKPAAVLKELGVTIGLAVPEPNTWRDLLRALDENSGSFPLEKQRVAVQEYGAPNPDLLRGLAQRGAWVTPVPVYQWALPEDLAPLRAAVDAIIRGEIDIVLFTTSVQVIHLLKIAAEMNVEDDMRRALARVVVGSIGPVTSQELRERVIVPDFEPVHPKMGFLVNQAAQQGAELLRQKRSHTAG